MMSSPRKYTSPYLTGLPGLPSSTGVSVTTKPKKKSRTCITKLSESAAAIKQVQDGIWQTAKEACCVSTSASGDQLSPRQDPTFDLATSFGGLAVGKYFEEVEDCGGAGELATGNLNKPEMEEKEEAEEQEEEDTGGAGSLVTTKDSIMLKRGNARNVKEDSQTDDWGVPPEETEELELEEQTESFEASSPPSTAAATAASCTELKSILKKSAVYKEKVKTVTRKKSISKPAVPKAKYGRPVAKEPKEDPRRLIPSKIKLVPVLPPSVMEVHNKFNNNQSKLPAKSPRKSKNSARQPAVTTSEPEKPEPASNPPLPRKTVRFSNRIDVHAVPYEPRGNST